MADENNKNDVKRLYLSDKDKKVSGVCGGLAEYFEVDPTLMRLLWIIVIILSGVIPGLIVYLIAAMVIPKRPETGSTS